MPSSGDPLQLVEYKNNKFDIVYMWITILILLFKNYKKIIAYENTKHIHNFPNNYIFTKRKLKRVIKVYLFYISCIENDIPKTWFNFQFGFR